MRNWWTILLICLPVIGMSQQLEISCSVDSAQIGEPIPIDIRLTYPTSLGVVEWPTFSEDSLVGGTFEVWEARKIQKNSNIDNGVSEMSVRQQITVAGFTPGFQPFQPIQVTIEDSVYESNPLLIKIISTPVDTTQAFKDIKPIASDPLTGWEKFTLWLEDNWWWVAIIVIVALTILVFFLFRKKKTIELPKELPKSIYEEYTTRYHELISKELWKKGDVKTHYLELTDLTRSYLFDRYSISTFEKTTHEIVDLISMIPADHNVKSFVIEVFKKSEYVKFAKQVPSPSLIELHNRYIGDFFESTRIEENQSEVKK